MLQTNLRPVLLRKMKNGKDITVIALTGAYVSVYKSSGPPPREAGNGIVCVAEDMACKPFKRLLVT